MEKGSLTGNKVTGVKFVLKDGDNHPVDSNEISFILAGEGAIKQAYTEATWQLIEPIMYAEITAPCEYQSAVTGNLNKRNALILSTEINQDWVTIRSEVALNDMFGYG